MLPKKRKAPAKRPPAARAPSPGRGSDDEEEEGAGGPTCNELAILWRDLEARVCALEREMATRRAATEEEEGAKPGQPVARPRSTGEDRPGGATCARAGAVGPGLPSPALPPCQGQGPPGGWAAVAPDPGLPLGGDAPWVPSGQTPGLPLPYGAPGPSGLAQPLCPPGRQMEGLDLGFHLLPSTKEKILRGEFVDLFSLLNRESSREEEEEDQPRVDRTWRNWLPAFLIYAGVLTRAQPCLGPELFEYLALIYKARVDYRDPDWRQYDEAFRRKKSLRPSLPWGDPHPFLWLLNTRPATHYEGVRTDSLHLLRWWPPPGEDDEEGRPGGSPFFRRLCWHFGTRGSCDRQPCKFQHRCSLCGGPHSFLDCPKGKRAKKFWGGRKHCPSGEEPPQDSYSD